MPRPKTEAAAYERVTLRLPRDVMQALRDAAHDASRPLNTQAILALRGALGIQRPPAAAKTPKR